MIKYRNKLLDSITKLDIIKVESVFEWMKQFESFYIVGNGGSQATAEHFVVDLLKYANKKAYSFSSSLLSMAGNDFGYSHGLYWCLKNYVGKNDLVFAISTSGQSENILRLMNDEFNTFLLTGLNGEDTTESADRSIIIPSDNTQILEDVSLIICHMAAMYLGGKL